MIPDVVAAVFPPVYDPLAYNEKTNLYKDFYVPDSLFHAYLWWATEVAYSSPLHHIGAILPGVCHEATRRGYTLESSLEPLRVWTCLLGGSGTGKSFSLKMGRKFFTEYHQQMRGAAFRNPFMPLGGSIQGVKHALATDHHDAAINKIVAILQTDELTTFLPRSKGSVTEDLCRMFDGEEIRSPTRTEQRAAQQGLLAHQSLENYTVQGLFATTFAALDEAASETYFTGGLFPRILWIRGHVKAEDVVFTPTDWQDVRRSTALDQWFTWAQWVDGYETLGGARVIRTTPEALVVFNEFVERYRAKTVDEDGGRFAPMYVRGLQDHVWKVAGAFAFASPEAYDVKGLTGVYIGPDDMRAAVHLVEACFQTFDKLATQVAVEGAARIEDQLLTAITAAGAQGVAHNSLLQSFPATRKLAQQALLTLLGAEEIDVYRPRATGGQKNPQGRPITYYFIPLHKDTAPGTIQAQWEKQHKIKPAVGPSTSKSGTVVTQKPSPPVGAGTADSDTVVTQKPGTDTSDKTQLGFDVP